MSESRQRLAREGVKGRVAELLRQRAEAPETPNPDPGQTLGEIGAALGLPKTAHGELSAALNKLRNEGCIRSVQGPATSPKGPRYVKRYSWARRAKAPAPAPATPSADIESRRFLSLIR